MPTYKYKTTIKGQVQAGEIEAENEQGAIAKLKQKNINVTSVKKKFESAFLSNKKPITERDIVIFTRQFSTMVDAGSSSGCNAWKFWENNLTTRPSVKSSQKLKSISNLEATFPML